MPTPRMGPGVEPALDEYIGDYYSNLRRIAIRLALHEQLSSVDVKHVDGARTALHRSGIIPSPPPKPWYRRTDWEFGIGTFFAGATASVPDVVAVVFPAANHTWTSRGIMAMTVLGGLLFAGHALLRKWQHNGHD